MSLFALSSMERDGRGAYAPKTITVKQALGGSDRPVVVVTEDAEGGLEVVVSPGVIVRTAA